MNEALLSNSRGKYTLKHIVDLLEQNGECVEDYNILVWKTPQVDIPLYVVQHAHIIILNGELVKDRPGVHFK